MKGTKMLTNWKKIIFKSDDVMDVVSLVEHRAKINC